MKRFKDWQNSGLMLDEFLKVGDEVDEEMFDYFCSVLPPVAFSAGYVQMGEPYEHIYDHITRKNRPTYYTIFKNKYCGKCFLSQQVEP